MTLTKSSIGTPVHAKPGFTVTQVEGFEVWRIDCHGGESLVVYPFKGTTGTQAAGRIARLVGAANELLAAEVVPAESGSR